MRIMMINAKSPAKDPKSPGVKGPAPTKGGGDKGTGVSKPTPDKGGGVSRDKKPGSSKK